MQKLLKGGKVVRHKQTELVAPERNGGQKSYVPDVFVVGDICHAFGGSAGRDMAWQRTAEIVQRLEARYIMPKRTKQRQFSFYRNEVILLSSYEC